MYDENVVYAPRKPTTKNDRVLGGAMNRSVTKVRKKPMTKLPVTLIRKVPYGKVEP